jgi:hypothetical protein
MVARLAEWQRLVAAARTRQAGDGGSRRLSFGDVAVLGELARLVAAEQACCPFLTFVITVDQTEVVLEVRAPAAAEAMLDSVFGRPP